MSSKQQMNGRSNNVGTAKCFQMYQCTSINTSNNASAGDRMLEHREGSHQCGRSPSPNETSRGASSVEKCTSREGNIARQAHHGNSSYIYLVRTSAQRRMHGIMASGIAAFSHWPWGQAGISRRSQKGQPVFQPGRQPPNGLLAE